MAFNDPRNSDPGYINFILKSDEQVQEFINSNDKITQDINLLQRSNSETGSRKSLTERLFSRIEAGSLRGSIFAMSSLALGTGCLALPLQLKNMSIYLWRKSFGTIIKPKIYTRKNLTFFILRCA